MQFELDFVYYILLFGVAIFAGFIDSIVGGGGLISLPALLACGIPSHLSLATNKLQAVFGSFTASVAYFRLRTLPHLALGICITGVSAAFGAFVALLISDKHLKLVILCFLTLTFLYTILRPDLGKTKLSPKIKDVRLFHLIFGTSIGFYDGFLGPATGSFWIFACVLWLGMSMKEASINTKILNFSSNLVALGIFLWRYEVLWEIGILMGFGQIIGAFLGSKLTLKTQGKFIKKLFLFVVGLTILKVAYDYFIA